MPFVPRGQRPRQLCLLVCTWGGEFIHDEAQIETGLYQMIIRCPELLEILIDDVQVEPVGLWSRVRRFFYRFRRTLDVSV